MAVRSWLKLGFRVTSINIAEEQKFLKTSHPEIKFVTPKRDGRKMVDKPLIYFDDILEYCSTSNAKVYGIINSDIYLNADKSLLDLILREAPGSMVYGSRLEVDSPVSARGWLYTSGFDYFFFDKALLGIYPKSNFMLGVPWWDYWAPLIPALKGFPLKNLHGEFAFHVSHPINYSWEQLRDFGLDLAKLIGSNRITRMHETHNLSLTGDKVIEREKASVTVLADMVRHQIAKSAKRLEWQGTPNLLNANALIDNPESECRVTAIVSTYNSEAFIAECLDDLVNQTIAQQLDIVVVDAASPQNERVIVEQFQQKHPNIRYLRTPERIGVYAAWNMVAKMAKGKYLISCSTNDRLRLDAMELMAQTLDERPEIAIVYGNSYLTKKPHVSFDTFDDLSGLYDWPDFSFTGLLKEPGIGPHPMWRRNLHDEFGYFDEQYKAIGDQDFWLRVARHKTCQHAWDFTGLYLLDDSSLSGNKHLAQAEYRQIREQHAREFEYQNQLKSKIFHKKLADFYDERIQQWKKNWLFEILILHTSDDIAPLVDTIQSMAGQYYPNIHMTVLSALPQPQGFGGERMSWAHVPNSDWANAINFMLQNGKGDWICVIQAGDKIAPHAFLLLGEHINSHPDWRLVYSDEDHLDAREKGGSSTPLFKPDFNLEMLCGSYYVGGLLVGDRGFLQSLGGLALTDVEAAWYDIVLRTWNITGNTGIGHVADVLYHRAAANSWAPTIEGARLAVQRHLERTGTPAQLSEGVVHETQRIIYQRDSNPLVSIILTFEGSVPLLERAIISLLDTTAYKSIEILVIDRGGDGKDARTFMDGLSQLGEPRIKLIDGHGDTTLARSVNRVVEHAQGEFILLFNSALVAVHQDWLDVLLNHGLRKNIGIVAPRIVYADGQIHQAGWVLGMMGCADSPYRGVAMEYSGYMNRLLLEQNVSAAGPECLLLPSALFRDLHGLDPQFAGMAHSVLDLCMKVVKTNRQIVWTPFATVLISGDACALEQADKDIMITEDDDRFYQRWLHAIAKDSAYNRNLTRSERSFGIERHSMLAWSPTPWKQLPKIIAHIADYDGCGNYRIIRPLNALLTAGNVEGNLSTDYFSPAEMEMYQPDSIIFQRQIKEEGLRAIDSFSKYSKGIRIFEIDDLITNIPVNSYHKTGFSQKELACFKESIRQCDRLIVSTEILAKAYGSIAPETIVVPNYLDATLWNKLKPNRKTSARPRIGWGGSVSHAGDLELIVEVIKQLSTEVDWIFFGMCPPALRPYIKEFHRGVSFNDYPAKLAALNLDLAIAPLEINAFNEAKSNLKLLEYGILGYPVICTDIYPYQGDFPVTRVPNKVNDWVKAIREHVSDLDACAKKGDELRAYVQKNWMLEDHLDVWLKAWLP